MIVYVIFMIWLQILENGQQSTPLARIMAMLTLAAVGAVFTGTAIALPATGVTTVSATATTRFRSGHF